MCSNTSCPSGADVSGSGGDVGDYASIILKKPKLQRVPKRGPGVAELEKILREQESKNHVDKGNVPFLPDHNNNYLSPVPPPQMTMLYSNGGKNNAFLGGGNGCNGGNNNNNNDDDVRIGGSGIIWPEQSLLPTVWCSCESSIYEEAPKISAGYPFSKNFAHGSDQMHHSPLMLQKKHCQYPSPTINLFPHSGSLSSSISDNHPSAGFYLHLEPPSNQRSSNHMYSPLSPDEEKMVGTKRPRNFSMENNSGPPIFHCQGSPFSHMHTLDQSLSSCNQGTAFNLRRDDTVSRDHAKKFITDYGVVNGNFLMYGSPATPSPLTQFSQQEFPKYTSLPFQESNNEGSQQMASHEGSANRLPFYSFIKPDEQTGEEGQETTLSLDSERAARRNNVDLNLKL